MKPLVLQSAISESRGSETIATLQYVFTMYGNTMVDEKYMLRLRCTMFSTNSLLEELSTSPKTLDYIGKTKQHRKTNKIPNILSLEGPPFKDRLAKECASIKARIEKQQARVVVAVSHTRDVKFVGCSGKWCEISNKRKPKGLD